MEKPPGWSWKQWNDYLKGRRPKPGEEPPTPPPKIPEYKPPAPSPKRYYQYPTEAGMAGWQEQIDPTIAKRRAQEKKQVKEWLEKYRMYRLYSPGVPSPAYFDPHNKLLHTTPLGYPVYYEPTQRKATLEDTGIPFIMSQYRTADLGGLWNEYWQEKAGDVTQEGFIRSPMYFDVEKRELTDIPTPYPIYWDERLKKMTFRQTQEPYLYDVGVTIPPDLYENFAQIYGQQAEVQAGERNKLYFNPRPGAMSITTEETSYPIFVDPKTGRMTMERTGYPYVASGKKIIELGTAQTLLASYLEVYGIKPNAMTGEGYDVYFDPIGLNWDIVPTKYPVYRGADGKPTFSNTGIQYKLTSESQFDIDDHMEDLMKSFLMVHGDDPVVRLSIAGPYADQDVDIMEDRIGRLLMQYGAEGIRDFAVAQSWPEEEPEDFFTDDPVWIKGPSGAQTVKMQGSWLEKYPYWFFENLRIKDEPFDIPILGGALRNNLYTSPFVSWLHSLYDIGYHFIGEQLYGPVEEIEDFMDVQVIELNKAKTQDEINKILLESAEGWLELRPDDPLDFTAWDLKAALEKPEDALRLAEVTRVVPVDIDTWRIVPVEEAAERREEVRIRWMLKKDYFTERKRMGQQHLYLMSGIIADTWLPNFELSEEFRTRARAIPMGASMIQYDDYLTEARSLVKMDLPPEEFDQAIRHFGITIDDLYYHTWREEGPTDPDIEPIRDNDVFIATTALKNWQKEQWEDFILPEYERAFELFRQGRSEEARVAMENAVRQDVAVGRDTGFSGAMSVTVAFDEDRMNEYIDAMVMASFQKGYPLSPQDMWMVKREYEDIFMEGLYDGVTEALLIMPDMSMEIAFRGLGKMFKGAKWIGGNAVRATTKIPYFGTVVSRAGEATNFLFSDSLRTMRYKIDDLGSRTFKEFTENTLGDTEKLADFLETSMRVADETTTTDEFVEALGEAGVVVPPADTSVRGLRKLYNAITIQRRRVQEMMDKGIIAARKNPFDDWTADNIGRTVNDVMDEIEEMAMENFETGARVIGMPEEEILKGMVDIGRAARKNPELLSKALAKQLSLTVARTSNIPGWGLMYDSLLYRSILKLGVEGSDVLRSLTRAWGITYGFIRNMWVFQVLSGRPAWLTRNIFDSHHRFLIAGGKLFDALGVITDLTWRRTFGEGRYDESVIEAFRHALPGGGKTFVKRIRAGEFAGKKLPSLIGTIVKENFTIQVAKIKDNLFSVGVEGGAKAMWNIAAATSRGFLSPYLVMGNTISDLANVYESGIRIRLFHKEATEIFVRAEKNTLKGLIESGRAAGIPEDLLNDLINLYRTTYDRPSIIGGLVKEISEGNLDNIVFQKDLRLGNIERMIAHLAPHEQDEAVEPLVDFFREVIEHSFKEDRPLTRQVINRLAKDAKKAVDEIIDTAARNEALQNARILDDLTRISEGLDNLGEVIVEEADDIGRVDNILPDAKIDVGRPMRVTEVEASYTRLINKKHKKTNLFVADWIGVARDRGVAIVHEDDLTDVYKVILDADNKPVIVFDFKKLVDMKLKKARLVISDALTEYTSFVDAKRIGESDLFMDFDEFVKDFRKFLKNPAGFRRVNPSKAMFIQATIGRVPGLADLFRGALGGLKFPVPKPMRSIADALGMTEEEVAAMLARAEEDGAEVPDFLIDASDRFRQTRANLGHTLQRLIDAGDQGSAAYIQKYNLFLSRILGDMYGGRLGKFMREYVPGPLRRTGFHRSKAWDDFFALGARFSESLSAETSGILDNIIREIPPETVDTTHMDVLGRMKIHFEFDDNGRFSKIVFPRTMSGKAYTITDRATLDAFYYTMFGSIPELGTDSVNAQRFMNMKWSDMYDMEQSLRMGEQIEIVEEALEGVTITSAQMSGRWPSDEIRKWIMQDPAMKKYTPEQIEATLSIIDTFYESLQRVTGLTNSEMMERFPRMKWGATMPKAALWKEPARYAWNLGSAGAFPPGPEKLSFMYFPDIGTSIRDWFRQRLTMPSIGKKAPLITTSEVNNLYINYLLDDLTGSVKNIKPPKVEEAEGVAALFMSGSRMGEVDKPYMYAYALGHVYGAAAEMQARRMGSYLFSESIVAEDVDQIKAFLLRTRSRNMKKVLENPQAYRPILERIWEIKDAVYYSVETNDMTEALEKIDDLFAYAKELPGIKSNKNAAKFIGSIYGWGNTFQDHPGLLKKYIAGTLTLDDTQKMLEAALDGMPVNMDENYWWYLTSSLEDEIRIVNPPTSSTAIPVSGDDYDIMQNLILADVANAVKKYATDEVIVQPAGSPGWYDHSVLPSFFMPADLEKDRIWGGQWLPGYGHRDAWLGTATRAIEHVDRTPNIIIHEYMHGWQEAVRNLLIDEPSPGLDMMMDELTKLADQVLDLVEPMQEAGLDTPYWRNINEIPTTFAEFLITNPQFAPHTPIRYLAETMRDVFTFWHDPQTTVGFWNSRFADDAFPIGARFMEIFMLSEGSVDDLVRARIAMQTAFAPSIARGATDGAVEQILLHPDDMSRMLKDPRLNYAKPLDELTDEDWIPVTDGVDEMVKRLLPGAYRDAVTRPRLYRSMIEGTLDPEVGAVAKWQLTLVNNENLRLGTREMTMIDGFYEEPLVSWTQSVEDWLGLVTDPARAVEPRDAIARWTVSNLAERGMRFSPSADDVDQFFVPPNPRWLKKLGYDDNTISIAETAWEGFLFKVRSDYPAALGNNPNIKTFDDFVEFLVESNFMEVQEDLWKAFIRQPLVGERSVLDMFGQDALSRDDLLRKLTEYLGELETKMQLGDIDPGYYDAVKYLRDLVDNFDHHVRSLRVPTLMNVHRAGPAPWPVWKMPRSWQTWLGANMDLAGRRQLMMGLIDEMVENVTRAIDADDLGRVVIPEEYQDEALEWLRGAYRGKVDNISDASIAATEKVGEYLLDYSQSSVFDEGMRSIFPFWMFPSRSVPFWIKSLGRHPEIFRWYVKYRSATDKNLRQRGLVTTSGEPIPSLSGKIRIPGSNIWIDPTLIFSWNFLIPRPWVINTMTDRYREDDDTTFQEAIHKTMVMGEFMGFNTLPWMRSQIETFTGEQTGFEDFTFFPVLELVYPPWMERNVRSKLRRTWLRSLADMPFWAPEYDFMDFLVEGRMLGRALEEIQDTDVTSRKILIAREAKEALGYVARYDHNGNYIGYEVDINREHPRWKEAYEEVYRGQYNLSVAGYFTGFYAREYTDAEAELYKLRHEMNLLKDAINNEILRDEFLPEDLGPRELYETYIDKRYESAEGTIYDVKGMLSFVRTASGETIEDPEERRRRIIELIDRGEREEAFYDSIEALQESLQKDLMQIPLGDDEARRAIFAAYFTARAAIEENPMFAEARRAWTFGYKPKELIEEHFLDTAMQMYREAKPVRQDGEDYSMYLMRLAMWEKDFEFVKDDMLLGIRQSLFSAVHGYEMDPNGDIHLPGDRVVNFVDIMDAVKKDLTRENYEAWIRDRMTVLDAIENVYSDNYISEYWDYVSQASDKFDREKRQREFMDRGTPTPEQIIEWVKEEYGDMFSDNQIRNALRGRQVISMEEKLAPDTLMAQLEDEIWEWLLWAGPSTRALRDRIEELGGRASDIDVWYATNGNPKAWGETLGLRSFHDILRRAVEDLGLERPNTATLTEWSKVRDLNDKFYNIAKESLGDDIEQIMTQFYNLDDEEQDAFLEEHPEVNLYRLLKDKFAQMYPVWAKYFNIRAWEEIQEGLVPYWIRKLEGTAEGGKGSGGAPRGRGRGGAGGYAGGGASYTTVGGSAARRMAGMGYRSSLDPRYLTPFTVGKAGAGGEIRIPAQLTQIVGKKGVQQIQGLSKGAGNVLSDVLANLLKRARYTFPDIAGVIDDILDLNAANTYGDRPPKSGGTRDVT